MKEPNPSSTDLRRDGCNRSAPRWWLALAPLVIVLVLLWVLGPLVVPLAVAGLLAVLVAPLRHRLQARGLTRPWAAGILAFIFAALVLAVFALMVPLLADDAVRLWQQLTEIDLERLRERLGDWLPAGVATDQVLPGSGAIKNVAGTLLGWGGAALNSLLLAVLLPIFMYFCLAESSRWHAGLVDLVPPIHQSAVRRWLDDLITALRGFLTGQGLVCLSQAIWHGTLLFLIGLDFALVLGVFTGLSALIPVIGNIVMLSITVAVATAQLDGWIWVLAVPLIFALGQAIEALFLAPWLIGGQAKLHPLAVIIAVMAGGRLGGFAGALLALPLLTVLRVTAEHLVEHYKDSKAYRNDQRNGEERNGEERRGEAKASLDQE